MFHTNSRAKSGKHLTHLRSVCRGGIVDLLKNFARKHSELLHEHIESKCMSFIWWLFGDRANDSNNSPFIFGMLHCVASQYCHANWVGFLPKLAVLNCTSLCCCRSPAPEDLYPTTICKLVACHIHDIIINSFISFKIKPHQHNASFWFQNSKLTCYECLKWDWIACAAPCWCNKLTIDQYCFQNGLMILKI